MDEGKFRTSRILKALGNPVRYQSFRVLGENGQSTSAQLVQRLRRSQSNISQHLSRLKNEDLISSKRTDGSMNYSVKREDIYELICELENRLSRSSR